MTNTRLENNSAPIVLTASALSHVQSFTAALGKHAGFRIAIKKSGCSGFSYIADVTENPQADDLNFLQNDVRIYLAADCVDFIRGTVVDFIDKGFGQKQLTFNNPNVKGMCGCGESFTVKEDEDERE